jgi:hypothetical protein
MGDLERRLERWVRAGIITAEQATAIREAEGAPGEARAATAPADGEARPGESTPSLAATALGYLGASVALVGGIVAASREWSRMPTGARLAVAAGAALALLVAGFIARRRRHPALRSLDTFLWFLSAGGAAFTAGLVAHDVLDLETRSISLASGAAAAAWAAPLWRLRRGALQEIAVFAGLAVFLEAVLAHLPGPPDGLHGLPLWGLAAAWALLGSGRVLPRAGSSSTLAGAGLLLGAQILSFGWRGAGLCLGITTAVAMLAASVALRSQSLLGFGAAGVLLFLPQIVFEYLGDTLGAPLALLVTGIVLLAGAFLTARLKGGVRTRSGGTSVPPATARRRGMVGAALVVALVSAAIWIAGIAPLPDFESLEARPDPSIPGQVAFVRWGSGPCVFVVPASGGATRRVLCSSEDGDEPGEAAWLGGPITWTTEGSIAVQAYAPEGNQVVVVDPRSGRVIERIVSAEPLVAQPEPDARRADGARLLVNRSGRAATLGIAPPAASPVEVARVPGPPGYAFWGAIWSPDGEWILVRDSNENLLVVAAREGARPRLLAERVSGEFAWHIPGTDAGLDLDSLRARRAASLSAP